MEKMKYFTEGGKITERDVKDHDHDHDLDQIMTKRKTLVREFINYLDDCIFHLETNVDELEHLLLSENN